ncbi:sensor histidine kinase [Rhizobium glycinendophyticum]|uniref:Histidine kinase n=1 Tax=Rhizobium glycinendophyticum TaxID=2589807 RepID=A0A504U9K4_9HYPH|nr:ATP-binding protein [Rhizobium glycinendophyticum]TPP11189.1 histidine kinase [Rhizobium glycinendophyticum]
MAVGFLLLQLAIVFICIQIRQIPFPRPSEAYRVEKLWREEATDDWHPVILPDYRPTAGITPTSTTYRAQFQWSPSDAGTPIAVFVPRFTTTIAIAINGSIIEDTARDPSKRRPDRNTPVLAPIAQSLLKPGNNQVTITLQVWGPLQGYLDSLYIGPDPVMRAAHDLRQFLFGTLPMVLGAWQITFGTILGMIWLNRRHDAIYGYLAFATVLGVVQHFAGLPRSSIGAGFLGAMGPLEAALMLHYILLLTGRPIQRYHALAFLPGLLIIVAAVLFSPQYLRVIYLVLGPPSVGILIAAVWLVLMAAVWQARTHAVYLATIFTAVLSCWALDVMTLNNLIGGERLFVGRTSYSLVLMALGVWLIWRFVQALKEADGFAATLVEKVAEAEKKLRANFAREEERARSEALLAERTRLMRDLHDGLGGQLVSIVALSEQAKPSGEAIGDAARAALKDLRLVVDAMEEINGDLMLALASWRERIDTQLRAHQMKLDWVIRGHQGLPIFKNLRSWHVIQLIRLMDEVVTNAVKHSGGKRVAVMIEPASDEAGRPAGRITIQDDGHGYDAENPSLNGKPRAHAGRGLFNIRRRAAMCDIRMLIRTSASGTRIELTLPAEFPKQVAEGHGDAAQLFGPTPTALPGAF